MLAALSGTVQALTMDDSDLEAGTLASIRALVNAVFSSCRRTKLYYHLW